MWVYNWHIQIMISVAVSHWRDYLFYSGLQLILIDLKTTLVAPWNPCAAEQLNSWIATVSLRHYSWSRSRARSHHLHGPFLGQNAPLPPHFIHHKMKPRGDMDATFAEIDRQITNRNSINFQVIVDIYGIERSTLSRRAWDITISH